MKDVKEKLEKISINSHNVEILLDLLRDEMSNGMVDLRSMNRQHTLTNIIIEKTNEVNKMLDELEKMVVKSNQIEVL